jgi:hypothetical protein
VIRVVLVALCVLAGTAHADRKKAEQLFNRGEKAYRAQKFLAAAQAFEAAYKELPTAPELAFSAAQAFRRQYRVDPDHPEYVESAIKYYELYLRDRKTGGRVGDAADSLDDMKAEQRHLEKTGKLGKAANDNVPKLAVSVELADHEQAPTKLHEIEDSRTTQTEVPVKVTIDNKVVEEDVLAVVTEGEHVVRAEAEGYKPAEKRVRVIAGVPVYEPLVLEPVPAQLTVETEAGARVMIDGRGVGEAPLAPLALVAGSHVVTVVRTGRKPVAREVTLERAKPVKVTIALEPTARRGAVKWVAIGSAVCAGAAGASAGFALYWNSKARDELALLEAGDQKQSVLDDYNSHRTNRDRAVDTAVIAGSAAVAIGLTAAWLYYFDSPSAEGVKVVPVASPTAAGAMISASF